MSAGKTVDTILAAHAARLEMGSGGELATQRLSRDVARALVADLRAAGHEADDVAADGGYYVYVTASLGTRAGDPMKLPELLEKLGVRAKAHPAPLPAHLVANFGSTRDVSKGTSWKVDLIGFDKRGAARVLQTPYWQGSAHKGPPSAADVVYSLVSDASCVTGSFEDYCSDMGCDPDSRRAERTYESIKAMKPRLEKFFGDELAEVVEACAEY